jgi:SAM-dependent methyltransferase
MSHNSVNMYDVDPHVAEIYDQVDTQTGDVEFLRILLDGMGALRILEPFCGTGRILLPLASDGHELVGLDQAQAMLDRARAKLARLPDAVRSRVTLRRHDVTSGDWPSGFDVVILGGNCFYELGTSDEQEGCVRSAALALTPEGWLFVDNDHMEGDLEASWQQTGVSPGFPSGVCEDGARVEGTGEAIWWDVRRRLIRFRRRTRVVMPDGRSVEHEFVQQKHPVSAVEVRAWLERSGFVIREFHGSYGRHAYTRESERAIFWAQKTATKQERVSGRQESVPSN